MGHLQIQSRSRCEAMASWFVGKAHDRFADYFHVLISRYLIMLVIDCHLCHLDDDDDDVDDDDDDDNDNDDDP